MHHIYKHIRRNLFTRMVVLLLAAIILCFAVWFAYHVSKVDNSAQATQNHVATVVSRPVAYTDESGKKITINTSDGELDVWYIDIQSNENERVFVITDSQGDIVNTIKSPWLGGFTPEARVENALGRDWLVVRKVPRKGTGMIYYKDTWYDALTSDDYGHTLSFTSLAKFASISGQQITISTDVEFFDDEQRVLVHYFVERCRDDTCTTYTSKSIQYDLIQSESGTTSFVYSADESVSGAKSAEDVFENLVDFEYNDSITINDSERISFEHPQGEPYEYCGSGGCSFEVYINNDAAKIKKRINGVRTHL